MGSGLAWLVIVAGVTASMWSMRLLVEANADRLIPYFGNPERVPRRSIVLRAAGAALLVLGVANLARDVGMWSVAVVIVASLPSMLWVRAHNRRLEEAPRPDDEPA